MITCAGGFVGSSEREAENGLELLAFESVGEEEDDELGDFSDEDEEEEAEMNPYEHDGTTYHRDEETDYLYTEGGDFWGHITEDGSVVEGEPEETEE